ncbi:MAG: type II toxin-antitoxin system HipA family toxin [Candidatus Cloacimonetes bacterium]|nr:type II toxin-antitoxin system HipA family toxin [Candidatus Cloacimonadota bacterium]
MRSVESVDVMCSDRKVGILSCFQTNRTAFEYDTQWLRNGFSISPFSLPLSEKVFFSEREPFDGMFGVFDDCLPDGWGKLILDRWLRKEEMDPASVNPISRLTLLSDDSFGLLSFIPRLWNEKPFASAFSIDELHERIRQIESDPSLEWTRLDDYAKEGGSSGGARPKVNILIDDDLYMVKFPLHNDPPGVGRMEYSYAEAASKCGISMAEHRLLGSGYFASLRFDRNPRVHMLSLAALLETSHRNPVLDYYQVFQSVSILTRSNAEMEECFRRMAFNVLARNNDDHAKNFLFIFDEASMKWKLSPAFDLTRSDTYFGERSTTVNGKGKNITDDDMLSYCIPFHLDANKMKEIIDRIRSVTEGDLAEYLARN